MRKKYRNGFFGIAMCAALAAVSLCITADALEDAGVASRDVAEDAGVVSQDMTEESETPESRSEAPAPSDESAEFLFPDSSTEYLTDADVQDLSLMQLGLARNEIIARHGRIFTFDLYRAYFAGKNWYEGIIDPGAFDEDYENQVNEVEKANIELIQAYEAQKQESGEGGVADPYAPVLEDYRQAEQDGYTGEHPYAKTCFSRYMGYDYPLCFAVCDLCADGVPELLIATYDQESNRYEIIDMYGTDGSSAFKLTGEESMFTWFGMCEGDVIARYSTSGGVSAGGSEYYRLAAGSPVAELIEGIRHDGYGECFHFTAADGSDGGTPISQEEYRQIEDSYVPDENAVFAWVTL